MRVSLCQLLWPMVRKQNRIQWLCSRFLQSQIRPNATLKLETSLSAPSYIHLIVTLVKKVEKQLLIMCFYAQIDYTKKSLSLANIKKDPQMRMPQSFAYKKNLIRQFYRKVKN